MSMRMPFVRYLLGTWNVFSPRGHQIVPVDDGDVHMGTMKAMKRAQVLESTWMGKRAVAWMMSHMVKEEEGKDDACIA